MDNKVNPLQRNMRISQSQEQREQVFPLSDVQNLQGNSPMEEKMTEIISRHDGLWNAEAEAYFLEHCKDI